MRHLIVAALLAGLPAALSAQDTTTYTRADSLRGSLTSPARTWWDVTFYDLHVRIDPRDSSIAGRNAITYRVVGRPAELQIDLQAPLQVDSMVQDGRAVRVRRDGDAWFARLPGPQPEGRSRTLTVYYHGRPKVARRPPWDGGVSWTRDSLGQPWVVTTAQHVGASIWWPVKDILADEPDSQRIALTVPDPMVEVSNGRLRSVTHHGDGTTTWEWFVANPINNYGVAVAAGDYIHFGGMFRGEEGPLTLDYWPLAYHRDAARHQWAQVPATLQCFEHWFGPYPWYRDGFKLVEVPYNGMEHQSAVAYGNGFSNGYKGRDVSGTGLGMLFDFIIVHETAHEWFGNNVTAKDNADLWIHESFANYAEGLYAECRFGREAGARYIVGARAGIRNDRPIIPAYGVNAGGSGDMYPKGGNMLHTIRQIVGNDSTWRATLRGLNREFRHRTVTAADVQGYIGERTGVELGKVFEQYLTTTDIPVLEYRLSADSLAYRWSGVVPGFDMPVAVTLADSAFSVLRPTDRWQATGHRLSDPDRFRVDENYYVVPRRVDDPAE